MSFFLVTSGAEKMVLEDWEEVRPYIDAHIRDPFGKHSTSVQLFPTRIEAENSARETTIGKDPLNDKAFTLEKADLKISDELMSNNNRQQICYCSICKSHSYKSFKVIIYVDGATRNNGSVDATSGFGVYYPFSEHQNVSSSLPRTINGIRTTNQRAELAAIRHVLKETHAYITQDINHLLGINSQEKFNAIKAVLGGRDPGEYDGNHYVVRTDSLYAIQCITEWLITWEANGYRNAHNKPVDNQDLIKECVILYKKIKEVQSLNGRGAFEFEHVRGHKGEQGNEIADQLAKVGADHPSAQNWS